MEIEERITTSIETLEAIYFLLKSYEANRERLSLGRVLLPTLTEEEKSDFLTELSGELDNIREQAGAIAENDVYRQLLRDARQHVGRAYLSKPFIDSYVFSGYEKVFPRWSHIKPHALVVFDGHTMEDLSNILEVESLLFADTKLLLERFRE